MSKSKGNVINPDEIIEQYGADSLRLFYMFLGPLEKAKPWSATGIQGSHRFLKRVWNLIVDNNGQLSTKILSKESDEKLNRLLHQTIRKVTEDVETLRFNTAISQIMILFNDLKDRDSLPRAAIETLVLLLSPFTPHLSEELWEKLGHRKGISFVKWPDYSEELAKEDLIKIAIQVNGKKRAEIEVNPGIDEASALKLAKDNDNVSRYLEDKAIKKTVLVKNRLLSIVV